MFTNRPTRKEEAHPRHGYIAYGPFLEPNLQPDCVVVQRVWYWSCNDEVGSLTLHTQLRHVVHFTLMCLCRQAVYDLVLAKRWRCFADRPIESNRGYVESHWSCVADLMWATRRCKEGDEHYLLFGLPNPNQVWFHSFCRRSCKFSVFVPWTCNTVISLKNVMTSGDTSLYQQFTALWWTFHVYNDTVAVLANLHMLYLVAKAGCLYSIVHRCPAASGCF